MELEIADMLKYKQVSGIVGQRFGLYLIKIHALNSQEVFRFSHRKVVFTQRPSL